MITSFVRLLPSLFSHLKEPRTFYAVVIRKEAG